MHSVAASPLAVSRTRSNSSPCEAFDLGNLDSLYALCNADLRHRLIRLLVTGIAGLLFPHQGRGQPDSARTAR